MYLRSACDWHLDPQNEDTIDAFLRAQGLRPSDVEPLSRDRYLEYVRWFQARQGLEPRPAVVERLDATVDGHARFHATLTGGDVIAARNVVLAIGFASFTHVPEDLARLVPRGRAQHTCELVDFENTRGQRCLIVGGRQSAFEWAALMSEAGAAAIHVSHRHDSPVFAASDWTWVSPLVERFVAEPGWYGLLTQAERDDLGRRLWAEGRLKLEPWLGPRVRRPEIHLWPRTQVASVHDLPDGTLAVSLEGHNGGQTIEVDRIVLATGYKVDVHRVPLLARGNLLPQLRNEQGAPVLDDHLQTNVPGLFMTSMLATRDFGPFFAFTVSVRASAHLIGQAVGKKG
jgi:cation diffusion facilitator CzcD-associated flavoprotein CzcO